MPENFQNYLKHETRHADPKLFSRPHGITAGSSTGVICQACHEGYIEHCREDHPFDDKISTEIPDNSAVRTAVEYLRVKVCRIIAPVSWDEVWF